MTKLNELALGEIPVNIALPVDRDGHEVRAFASRASAKDDAIEGYAALFDVYSEDLGGFVEIIEPGFFDGALEDENIRALWQHKPEYVLGRTKNGTLTVSQDEVGLAFRASPPVKAPNAATWAQDALASIRRGDVDQCSFSFSVKYPEGDEWYFLGDKLIRRLKKGGCARLWDVSPVTYPAYKDTQVSARSIVVARIVPGAETSPEPAQGEGQEDAIGLTRLAYLRRRLELADKA